MGEFIVNNHFIKGKLQRNNWLLLLYSFDDMMYHMI